MAYHAVVILESLKDQRCLAGLKVSSTKTLPNSRPDLTPGPAHLTAQVLEIPEPAGERFMEQLQHALRDDWNIVAQVSKGSRTFLVSRDRVVERGMSEVQRVYEGGVQKQIIMTTNPEELRQFVAQSRPLAGLFAGGWDAGTVAQLVANVIPCIGILYWNWSFLELLVIYGIEMLIRDGFALLKIAIARGPYAIADHLLLFDIHEFFSTHWTGRRPARLTAADVQTTPRWRIMLYFIQRSGLLWAVVVCTLWVTTAVGLIPWRLQLWQAILIPSVSFLVSHAISFSRDYLPSGQRRKFSPVFPVRLQQQRLIVGGIALIIAVLASYLVEQVTRTMANPDARFRMLMALPLFILVTAKAVMDIHEQRLERSALSEG